MISSPLKKRAVSLHFGVAQSIFVFHFKGKHPGLRQPSHVDDPLSLHVHPPPPLFLEIAACCAACCPIQIVKELLERFEAHLTAEQYFSVIANMKGTSPEDVATRLLRTPGLQGLQVGSGGCQADRLLHIYLVTLFLAATFTIVSVRMGLHCCPRDLLLEVQFFMPPL